MNKYSMVFMPNVQTIELIKQMKLKLANEIGWFNSKNSLAHFTIFEFLEDSFKEDVFGKQLQRIASEMNPFEVHCNAFDFFENGAFYIKPCVESEQIIRDLMKQTISEANHIKKSITNTTPHLTIGRRLTPEQLIIAKNMFQEINFSFKVTHLTLRKFDEDKRQFTIYKEFPLLGKPKEIQGSLF